MQERIAAPGATGKPLQIAVVDGPGTTRTTRPSVQIFQKWIVVELFTKQPIRPITFSFGGMDGSRRSAFMGFDCVVFLALRCGHLGNFLHVSGWCPLGRLPPVEARSRRLPGLTLADARSHGLALGLR
jgi:hypothetical protein